MKLKEFINSLPKRVDTNLEIKGKLVSEDCDTLFNTPYMLRQQMLFEGNPFEEITRFNIMQDSRRGFWVLELKEGNEVILTQLCFNREGDDRVETFIFNKDRLCEFIDTEFLETICGEVNYIDNLKEVSKDVDISENLLNICNGWLKLLNNEK